MAKALNSKLMIMQKYQNTFCKRLQPSWSEEVFGIKKVKNTVP